MRSYLVAARCLFVILIFCLTAHAGDPSGVQSVESAPAAAATDDDLARRVGVAGGLCVQVGAQNTDVVTRLGRTGRFLVQVLDADEKIVDDARRRLKTAGLYGLITVDRLPPNGGLPYTENLVNLLIVAADSADRVAPQEADRVLCPRGVVAFVGGKVNAAQWQVAGLKQIPEFDMWVTATKPWPAEMDEWSHPRHSASGNAVSHDTQVAPPRRVRWVVGAQAEVRGMVTAGGRNFYAGVLARDGFNGLRLWQRDLVGPPTAGRFTMRNLGPHHAPPVSSGDRLYVVDQGKLLALDAATGNTLCQYPDAGQVRTVLFEKGTLIVATGDAVRALDAESTKLKWSLPASEPRHLVAGDDTVAFVGGRSERGEAIEAVVLNLSTGDVRWKRSDFPWLPKVTRTVYHRSLVAYEVSTLSDVGPGNALHLVSATDGKMQVDHPFLPGMNHIRQARAMFIGDRLWLLHGGRTGDDRRLPIQVSALDFQTGEVVSTYPAGLAHCFPPVMTTRYMLSGEFDLTDLATVQVDAHQITKAACGRDGGWVPANGLIYVTPKHCVCWPMLRGYTALAPERPAGSVADMALKPSDFVPERGVHPPAPQPVGTGNSDWPSYRHDPWRSGSTPAPAPSQLKTLWTAEFARGSPAGPIVEDWQENVFVKGPITSPVIAGDRVVIARPDAHEVVALDTGNGSIVWRFTASGRVDTAPTLHQGLCLFGSKSGWVYALRLDNGQMVWRLRAAPLDEQIVAYGQLESPWPVPGSVLVCDDVAYFAAGRQSLADGGILIFAVDPASGAIHWVQRLDSVPQRGFYECSGLEFDNFDLLHREGDKVGMSRWVFDRTTGNMSLDRWAAFAKLDTGNGAAMVPRGCWSYTPRHQQRIPSYTPLRPLAVFRDNVLYGGLQGTSTIYRRDFDLDGGETFDTRWITGWAASAMSRDGKMPWRSHRLAERAAWRVDVFGDQSTDVAIEALLLADDRLFVAGSNGDLRILATGDGKQLGRESLPSPLWDGMAVANGRLYYATRGGQLHCLGMK